MDMSIKNLTPEPIILDVYVLVYKMGNGNVQAHPYRTYEDAFVGAVQIIRNAVSDICDEDQDIRHITELLENPHRRSELLEAYSEMMNGEAWFAIQWRTMLL